MITGQRGHAICNGIYVAAVNRVGFERIDNNEGREFWGSYFICGPQGEIISQASNHTEEIIYGTVDCSEIEYVWRNCAFLSERWIDVYNKIINRNLD